MCACMYVILLRGNILNVLQLTDEERLYLSAAALGDVPIIRQSLEEAESSSMNVNCVDYMGRSALHLAVDSENMEAIELLLDKLSFECTEEALLHAISKGATKIVKVSIAQKSIYYKQRATEIVKESFVEINLLLTKYYT